LGTEKVVGRITPHGSAFALDPIAIAPGGNTAYVVSDNVLTPIDLASGLAKAPISLGSPTGGIADATGLPSSIAIAPDGRTAYVAIPGKGTIVPVQLAPLSSASPIVLGGTPQSIAIAPNGDAAYVTNTTTNAVDVVNLVSGAVSSITGIVDPLQIAITPNGARAYVTTGTAIIPIDLTVGSVLPPIKVGSITEGFVPGPIVVSRDGQRVYVANTESATGNATVLVASTRSNTIIHSLGGFSQPVGISFAGDGHTLYVLNVAPSPGAVIGGGIGTSLAVQKNALVPIDLNSGVVRTPILLPAAPRSIGLGR
jgi:DNA-binding beta-propeller fold protein YncE